MCSSLQEIVAAAAAQHASRVAVTYDSGSLDGSSVSLSYSDVVSLVQELSQILQKSRSRNNSPIALYCHADLYLPVWILGILSSPAAYVPLDPDAPGSLSARILSQCGIRCCAVQTELLQQFQTSLIKHLCVDMCEVLPRYKLTLIRVKPLPDDVHRQTAEDEVKTEEDPDVREENGTRDAECAYVLHTSGTTGLPKIVRVPHRCILPNILHLRSLFQMNPDDVVFLASPLTFDPSVVELFLALSSGAQLLIVPKVIKKMPRRLSQLLFKNHKTTVLQVTPTLLGRFGRRILTQHVLCAGSSLRVLALGGEACPSPALLRSWRQDDNTTQIYNVYGITEVSCWACCYRIPEALLQSSCLSLQTSVPLGTPLMDTVVEVRDENGCVVTEGEGQVFIGGKDRVCLLDDEDTAVPGTMRATGDRVKVKDKQLYYLGRRDRLIKRHGQRVDLDSLQEVIASLPEVDACAVCLDHDSPLIAFVVASTSGDQKAASSPLTSSAEHVDQIPSASAQHQEDISPSGKRRQETSGPDGDLSRLIVEQLSPLLPSYSIPDTLVLVPALPTSSHGKVDVDALMKIYQRQRLSLKSEGSGGDVSRLKQTLQSLWQVSLGLAVDVDIEDESRFLFSGGDSLKALRLCEDVVTAVEGVTLPELLEVILDGSFSEVLRHVARATLTPLENDSTQQPEAKKRHGQTLSQDPVKRGRTGSTATERIQRGNMSLANRPVKVIRRASEVIEVNTEQLRGKDSTGKIHTRCLAAGTGSPHMESRSLGLSLSWSSDTGRCVDASPILLVQGEEGQRSESAKATVFIGSHSHRMQAIDLDTGDLLWERVLGDRIEASAAVSQCGTLLITGCYDGCVYFLSVVSGETQWVFETGDAVKSGPAVDDVTGLVMVGSHDGHVYGLDPKVCVFPFPGSSVCVEASLWGRGCVLLPAPPFLLQAALCGVTGRKPSLSPS
ncbi:beta-alanine-activating enzyme isoform X2 [Genypterus blacodes]|uniref:beta-alanine-activating enzyme isoform X2 n=1 Tax=Genypterus blacodes TaxID=154954 RepID=UPI003F7708F3